MNLEISSFADTKLVRVKKRKLTYPALAEFYSLVSELLETGARHLVINLSEVSYLDSAALGCLMDVSRNMHARNGTVALVGMQERVAALVGMVGLTHHIEVFAEEGKALESSFSVPAF